MNSLEDISLALKRWLWVQWIWELVFLQRLKTEMIHDTIKSDSNWRAGLMPRPALDTQPESCSDLHFVTIISTLSKKQSAFRRIITFCFLLFPTATYHRTHLYTLLGTPLDIVALTQICNQPIICLQLMDAFGWWWRRAAEVFWMWCGCWCQAGWSAGLSQTAMVYIKIQRAGALQEKILVDVRGELELQSTQAHQNWTTDDGTTFRDLMSLSLLQHLD